MYRSAAAFRYVSVHGIDPTDHGSNLGVVAGLAVGILVFIGLLVFLITRRGGRGAAARRTGRLTIPPPQPPQPLQPPPRPAQAAPRETRARTGGADPGTEPDEEP